MAKNVIEHLAKVKKEKMFQLLYLKWQVLKEIVYVLQIPLRATISLQRQDLTLSDVFGIWMKIKIHLQACSERMMFKTNLTQQLLNSLNNKKRYVFNNQFMSSALFLDPRYRQFIMNDAVLVEKAKQTLFRLWQRINVNYNQATASTTQNVNEQANDDFDFQFDEQAELNKLIFGVNNNGTTVTPSQSNDIELSLDMFNPEPISSENSVLEFWANEEKNHPDLHKLAMVVYAIPPTEVENEREFSRLNFVFNDRRCKLQAERLEDIMILHINPEVFHLVKKEEIDSSTNESNFEAL